MIASRPEALFEQVMSTSRQVLAGIAAALALALMATVTVKLNRPAPGKVTDLPAGSPCDLQHGPCSTRLPNGGRLEFSIGPRPIPVLKPIRLQARVAGVAARSVEVDFAATDMDMGFNRVALKPAGDGNFTGQGMLPVCVRNRMSWRASVLIDAGGGAKLSIPFLFDTVRN
jgi:hypothetical protein